MSLKTTSIIGLSKNAGKTTLLNYLINKLTSESKKLGIASIGVDGEDIDVWSSQPKPAITVSEGCFVATTADGLNYGTGEWKVIAKIDLHSITGSVYIAEALTSGTVKLLGTHTLDDIVAVQKLYEELGIEEFLIDGAYDRLASANPILTDQTYLVIGASLHEDKRIFWNNVYQKIYPFFFQKVDNEQILLEIWENQSDGKALVLNNKQWLSIPIDELFSHKAILSTQTEWLYLPGVLLENTLVKLLNKKLSFNIVLRDGLKSFVSLRLIERWYRAGGTIQVINAVDVKGIAINPYSPSGYAYSTNNMKTELIKILNQINRVDIDIPIIDIWKDELN